MKYKFLLLIPVFFFLYTVFSEKETKESIILGSNSELKDKSLYLANETNLPLVIIGDTEINPRYTVSDIIIEDLIIDGNFKNQSHEINGDKKDGIRNSGIVIRKAENVIIRNCIIRHCRSAGVVIEKGCKNILIENCEIYYNYFDGIAGYDSEECEIRNCRIHSNRAAALSFDWNFNDVLVRDCVFHHNETAVFIRDCKNISFGRIKMLDNKRFGWYITQRDEYVETTPENITFFEIEDDSPDTLINVKKNNKTQKDGY